MHKECKTSDLAGINDAIKVTLFDVISALEMKIYIDRSKRLIGLCQSSYVEKILKRFNMETSKHRSISMQDKPKLNKSHGALAPDEVKRIGDRKRELRVACYTDVGYLTYVDDLNSQIEYVFVLNKGFVDCKSTKQSILATSSTEAEYIATSDASKEAVWIRKFTSRLGVVPTNEVHMKIYCDNTRAIATAKNKESPKVPSIIVPKFTIFLK
nr:hypothetical protein [Tanacetum cinerariifolium]